MQTVNEKGIQQIAKILKARHKSYDDIDLSGSPYDPVTGWYNHIAGYVDSVEYQLDVGNSPSFEISCHDTLSGHTEVHDLDDDCIDVPLVDRVIKKMLSEIIDDRDLSVIEGLLLVVPEKDLINYLAED